MDRIYFKFFVTSTHDLMSHLSPTDFSLLDCGQTSHYLFANKTSSLSFLPLLKRYSYFSFLFLEVPLPVSCLHLTVVTSETQSHIVPLCVNS